VGNGGAILHTATGGTGVQPPVAPTLISPPNGGQTLENPTLSWNASPGALWYTLQISNTPWFKTIIMNQTGISANLYSPPGLQLENTYYWRVSVTDSSGTSSWSETWSFTISLLPHQVVLISPVNGTIVTSDSQAFSWHQSIPDVDRYWLETATDSLFTIPSIDSLLTDTTKVVYQLALNETYWWRVRAHNSMAWGPFSEVRNFSVLVTDVDKPNEMPTLFSLAQNYPNPFNPVTTISYELPVNSYVTLILTDVLGREVTRLVDDPQEAGYKSVTIDASSLASGIYLYRIIAGKFTATKRMLLIK
jgi:hypothetical protein